MTAKNEKGFAQYIIPVILGGALILAAISLYGYAVSMRNQGLTWETDLNTVYRSYETETATYVNTFYEQTGLADLKSEKMNQILKNAMEGRYGENPQDGNLLFKAVSEAYPDLNALNIYDKILPTVQAGREGIRNKQNLVIEKAQKFNNWRKQGILRAWVLSGVYPSRDLQVRVGGKTLYGEEALNQLSEPIINSITDEAFQKHQMEPLKVK